ncbi:hypothetical protein F0562_022023 [Nyssa sinensis]|uniref:Uncharacterized protein n=1 Tax=Nyssa sinensis TaxID=561372 RepID=A0A5J5BNT4_9ASTE|nr:hypothetical protein F0562_022023 [Nyssa sinensis]
MSAPSACGVDRYTVGISSDALLEPPFTAKLCSPACYLDCPNIVDLYHNLALAEGVFLRELCKAQRTNPRRAMAEFQSSGEASVPASAAAAGPAPVEAAAGPVSSDLSAPVASSPASM